MYMNSFESVENTLYGPLYSKENCSIFEGASVGVSIAIIINIFTFIYLLFTSKHLANSIILIGVMLTITITNISIYYICRVLRGMCLKSLN